MASAVPSHETGHTDTVHDVQLDYYGRKLATASSDRTIRVFDIAGDQLALLATLQGHDGPVWQVSWSHPKFGNLLASCSFDNRIMIWKEQQDSSWTQVRLVWYSTLHCVTSETGSVIWAASGLHIRLKLAHSIHQQHSVCTP